MLQLELVLDRREVEDGACFATLCFLFFLFFPALD